MEKEDENLIGPKITGVMTNSHRLALKLNHFFTLKSTKGISLNQQLAAHPDFHAPGITDTLIDFMGLDPWASNLAEDVTRPDWERLSWETESYNFDYVKIALEQRQAWESKNPQIMNATTTMTASTSKQTFNPRAQMPRKRI